MELFPKRKGKLIGSGAERGVYAHPDKPKEKLVTAEGRTHPLEAKAMFYTQRILSGICPDNFPAFTGAFTDENGRGSVIRARIRETVSTRVRRAVTETLSRTDGLDTRNSYKRFGEREYDNIFLYKVPGALEKYGIKVNIDFTNDNNFRLNKNGTWNYVDTVLVKELPPRKKLADVGVKMREDLPAERANQVLTAIERMYYLQDEMKKYLVGQLSSFEMVADGINVQGYHIKLDLESRQTLVRLKEQLQSLPEELESFTLGNNYTKAVKSLYEMFPSNNEGTPEQKREWIERGIGFFIQNAKFLSDKLESGKENGTVLDTAA